LGEICSKLVDGDHNPPKGINEKTEYLMISSRNINHNQVEDLENVRYLTKDIFDTENKRTNLQVGDILFTSVGSLGRSCVYAGGLNLCFQRSVTIIHTNQYNFWLKYYFDSDYYQAYILDNATGTAQLGFYLQQMEKSFIPLPPLAEQERIVSVIKSIFSQIDTLDQNKSDLQTVIKQTKSKILDLAIHGKLVPQDPNDEPAEELLKRIATSDNRPYEKVEDEPFDIPDSWRWVKLGDIGQTNIGLTYHPNDISNTGITVLRSNNIQNNRLCFDDVVKVNSYTKILNNQYINNGDILICARNGSQSLVGKCVLIDNLREKTSFGAFMAVFRSHYNKYILKYLQSKYFKDYMFEANSTQIHQLTQSMLKDALIPFPPEKEQVRIVAKIDELCSKLNQIQNNIV
jgi:type I restriction enzyme S subunit